MQDNNKNLLLATALSFLVIFAWFLLFPPEPYEPEPEPDQQVTDAPAGSTDAGTGTATAPPADDTLPGTVAAPDTAQAARIPIRTGRLDGSMSIVGGRIDDLALSDYNVRLNDPSEKVVLLSPADSVDPYYVLYGWSPGGDLDFEDVPGANTRWEIESGTSLSESTPVTLRWDNGRGLVFRRQIAIDENYLFTITQSVENSGNSAVRLAPYGIVARHGEPEVIGFYILHEGVVRSSDGTIQEIDYDDMPDQEIDRREAAAVDSIAVEENGWVGFTDKYWMTTLIPQPGQSFTSVSKYTARTDTYQTDMRLPAQEIPAGTTARMTTMLFAGAKEYTTIITYERDLGINQFIDSIDWGWFFFLTKPIFQLLLWLNGIVGNMGWSIICLTFVIKALLFPLAYKSYVSLARMKELQPEMEKIKERVGDDRQKMQKEMMALYRDRKVNPASGCLPILPQIPIFFSLYKVLFVTIEIRHAPFIGWIEDLSAPDPTSILNLFGLLPWGTPGPESIFYLVSIGVYPVLMGVSMWMQQKLNPAPTDKTQAMVFAWMPWMFMFLLGSFASGLVIYWVANNIITFVQQYAIMRSQGVKPDVFGNIIAGFRRNKTENQGPVSR
ncbi:MAG: membrane protein insertase YidC [Rhodobacteraceae bacterium]|nr:membrane protein insertase YidC [Paracoccaceae bacterium]